VPALIPNIFKFGIRAGKEFFILILKELGQKFVDSKLVVKFWQKKFDSNRVFKKWLTKTVLHYCCLSVLLISKMTFLKIKFLEKLGKVLH